MGSHILRQQVIKRQDARDNPHVLYLFSDDCDRAHEGGWARELRDEENAVGIRVKWNRRSESDSYFRDRDLDEIVAMLEEDFVPVFEHIENGGIVVIPSTGIGTGIGKLSHFAPRVFAHLSELLERLEAA